MNNLQNIHFNICRIEIVQFAILINTVPTENIVIGTDLTFGTSNEDNVIAPKIKFTFETNRKPFIILEVVCYFKIKASDWKKLEKDSILRLPTHFSSHITMLTVGTARGILHCKTESTPFNSFIIPPIDITNMIKEDMELQLD